MPKLPLELVALVIHHLAPTTHFPDKEDLKPLKTCSLVSKTWAILCRPHLFRTVELGFSIHFGKTVLHRLAKMLTDTPTLAKYIRTVRFTTIPIFVWNKPYVSMEYSDCQDDSELQERLDLEDSLGHTLLNLPNVRELEMHLSVNSAYEDVDIDVFGHRMFLEHYVANGQLTTIIIQGYVKQLPIMPFLSSPRLERLEITECTFELTTEVWDTVECLGDAIYCSTPAALPDPMKTFSIKELTLISCDNFPLGLTGRCKELEALTLEDVTEGPMPAPGLHGPQDPILFNRLHTVDSCTTYIFPLVQSSRALSTKSIFPIMKSLSFHYDSYERPINPYTANFLLEQSQVLEFLFIENTFQDYDFSELNLSEAIRRSHDSLKHLSIKWCIESTDDAFLCSLCDALECVRSQNFLESLTVILIIKRRDPDEFDESDESMNTSPKCLACLSRLDVILTREKQLGFPFLERVKFSIKFLCSAPLPDPNIVDNGLKNLSESPYIHLECTIGPDIRV
ncbi:hypothetical protein CVT24_011880 [Panaeolus cyanescens]|uniref:F-box domain-containing protein n=1 Tax=Panaeolus cyanescens TaxID=181874 RepID=A0A409YNS5_9AGAR|nr:hypothetical protein CVT24_011880 [Panaeolus cyanescens]